MINKFDRLFVHWHNFIALWSISNQFIKKLESLSVINREIFLHFLYPNFDCWFNSWNGLFRMREKRGNIHQEYVVRWDTKAQVLSFQNYDTQSLKVMSKKNENKFNKFIMTAIKTSDRKNGPELVICIHEENWLFT